MRSYYKMNPTIAFLFCTIAIHAVTSISVPVKATDRVAESGEVEITKGRSYADAKPSQWQQTVPNKRVGQFPRETFPVAGAGASKSNIVYGKGKVEQPKFNLRNQGQKPKYQSSKFVASPEDTIIESEGVLNSQFYKNHQPYDQATLQKYMQRYANQLYNTHKHAGQLSEAQKHVLSQEVNAKKYTVPQAQVQVQKPAATKYPATSQVLKYSEPQQQSYEASPSLQDYAEPITADKYASQSYQSQQKYNVQPLKPQKSTTPKKVTAYLYDNSPQPTDYKYQNLYGSSSLEPQVLNQYFSPASNDKDTAASTGYEQHTAYGHYGVGSTDRLEAPKITGYKIPGAVALSLGDEYSHDQAEEKHEHATHEPKYEFMYQVQDHEKHNHFGHSEARKGKSTWGKYFVQLPDGRFETVKYYADKSGYHAEIEFKGHAKHPSHKEHGSHSLYKGYEKADAEAVSYSGLGSVGGQSEDYTI